MVIVMPRLIGRVRASPAAGLHRVRRIRFLHLRPAGRGSRLSPRRSSARLFAQACLAATMAAAVVMDRAAPSETFEPEVDRPLVRSPLETAAGFVGPH